MLQSSSVTWLYGNFGPVNLSSYKTFKVTFGDVFQNTKYANGVGFSTTTNNESLTATTSLASNTTKSIDVSSLSGSQYVIFKIHDGSDKRYINVSNAWFE